MPDLHLLPSIFTMKQLAKRKITTTQIKHIVYSWSRRVCYYSQCYLQSNTILCAEWFYFIFQKRKQC